MSRATDLGVRILRNRRLVRAPIWLYRLRAGAVLGPRLLMLEHLGRVSGKPRYVVLEAVAHPDPDTYVLASGFGSRAQWFRNVVAHPEVRVWTGSRAPRRGTARVLDQDAVDRVLTGYRSAHPTSWAQFTAILEQTLGHPITDTGTPMPMVEVRLAPG